MPDGPVPTGAARLTMTSSRFVRGKGQDEQRKSPLCDDGYKFEVSPVSFLYTSIQDTSKYLRLPSPIDPF